MRKCKKKDYFRLLQKHTKKSKKKIEITWTATAAAAVWEEHEDDRWHAWPILIQLRTFLCVCKFQRDKKQFFLLALNINLCLVEDISLALQLYEQHDVLCALSTHAWLIKEIFSHISR